MRDMSKAPWTARAAALLHRAAHDVSGIGEDYHLEADPGYAQLRAEVIAQVTATRALIRRLTGHVELVELAALADELDPDIGEDSDFGDEEE